MGRQRAIIARSPIFNPLTPNFIPGTHNLRHVAPAESHPPFEGIIIRTFPYGEADIILRVISPERGKVSLIAKNARNSKKRFPNSMDLLDYGIFESAIGRGSLEPVLSFRPHAPFRALRESLEKLIAASVVCESFDMIVHDHSAEADEYFEVLSLGLRAIEDAKDIREALRGCFLTLHSLLATSGFPTIGADKSPSAKHLMELVTRVEECAEKDMLSKSSLVDLIRSLHHAG